MPSRAPVVTAGFEGVDVSEERVANHRPPMSNATAAAAVTATSGRHRGRLARLGSVVTTVRSVARTGSTVSTTASP